MKKEEFEEDFKNFINEENNKEDNKKHKDYKIDGYLDFYIYYKKDEEEIFIVFENINKEKKIIYYEINKIYEYINYFVKIIYQNKKINGLELLFEDVCDQTYSYTNSLHFNYNNNEIIIKDREKEMKIKNIEEFDYKIFCKDEMREYITDINETYYKIYFIFY